MVEHDLAKVGVASSSLVSRSSLNTVAFARCSGGEGLHGASRRLAVKLHIAGIAQLVEHDLAKVGVASSSLVSRSILKSHSFGSGFFLLLFQCPGLA